MKQKYIGKKSVNELRRRGKKVPDALTYEQIVTKINSAYLQVKAKDDDVITITKTPTYDALMNAKTPAEKRAAERHFSKLHDEYKFSFRDMAIVLNSIEYVDSPSRPERQVQISETLARKGERFAIQELKAKNNPTYSTPKGKITAAKLASARVRKFSTLTLSVFKRRLEKSMEAYPEYLKKLVLGQIELKGEAWLSSQMNGNLSSFDVVLSSDRGIVSGAGEFEVFDFFDLQSDIKIDDDYQFKTLHMTGKEFNELINMYVV